MCVCVPEQFLGDGDISVDIGVTAAPVITANYVESYHKVNFVSPCWRGLISADIWVSLSLSLSSVPGTDSVPEQLRSHHGLCLSSQSADWRPDVVLLALRSLSVFTFNPASDNSHVICWSNLVLVEHQLCLCLEPDQVFNPMVAAAHEDGRFQLNISAAELRVSRPVEGALSVENLSLWANMFFFQELFNTSLSSRTPGVIREVRNCISNVFSCFCEYLSMYVFIFVNTFASITVYVCVFLSVSLSLHSSQCGVLLFRSSTLLPQEPECGRRFLVSWPVIGIKWPQCSFFRR